MTRARPGAVLAFLLLAGRLAAQTPTAPEPPEAPEAPEAIFDEKIGDVGVVLQADGTWTTKLAAGWGQGFSALGVLPGLGYPGYEKEPVFTQVPDFGLTLRLLERYYLEVTYRGSLDDRSLLAGYQGAEGELVSWVKAGNAAFGVPARAGEQLAEGRRGAPAAGAAFRAGPVSLELLARYEGGTRETRSFRGYRDAAAATIALDTWIRNRFFVLPSAGLSGVTVVIQDPAGTLGGYRTATSSEYSWDAATGEIRLDAPASRRMLVTWTGAAAWLAGSPVTAQLGLSPVQDSSPPSGGPWLVLAQPGSASFFEARDRYPVSKGNQAPVVLTDRTTGLPVAGYRFGQAPAQDWFQVSGGSEAPFFATLPGLYPASAAGIPPLRTAVLPWAFRLDGGTDATSYNLGSDVLASSVVVSRNGAPTSAYTFDPAKGTLAFTSPIYETDEVEISFQRSSPADANSNLVLWQGGRWAIDPGQALEWNLQGRWNLDKSRYTTEDLQAPGKVAASLAWTGAAGPWSWSARATGGALLADSTGHRRLYSHADSGTEAPVNGSSLRPAAAPGTIPVSLGPTLTEANRAPSFARDYWTNDTLTGLPQPGTWGKPGISRLGGGAGGWTGPYLVLGDGTESGRMGVAEADFSATDDWTGLSVFLDAGRPVDLRSTSAITVNVRVPEGVTGTDLYFQAGTLSTDFDGTGAKRSIEYRNQPALRFVNQRAGVTQYVPVPEGATWGNDAAGSGAPERDGTLVTRQVTGLSGTGWQTVTFTLTDAERQSLQRTTGWRLILAATGAAVGTRTLLTGPVVFEGSTWSVAADSGASAGSTVSPVEEARSDGDGQQLRVDWTNRGTWTVNGRHTPVRPASYRALTFQYQSTTASTYQVVVQDSQGRGVTAVWTSGVTSGWTDVVINYRTKVLTVGGVPTGSVTVSGGGLSGSWDRLSLSQSGATGGTLLLGQIEAVDPVWEALASTTATLAWKAGGWSLEATTRQEGLTADTWAWSGESRVSGSLGPLNGTGEASYAWNGGGTTGHGAYTANLPLALPFGVSVRLAERFSDRGLRAETLALGLPFLGTFEAAAQAEGPPATLEQDYRGTWTSPVQWPSWFSAGATGEWSQSRPYSGPFRGFAGQWQDSWLWLPPDPALAPFALLQGKANAKLSAPGASLQASASSQVAQSLGSSTGGQSPTWSPSGTWSLSLPLQPAEGGGWTLVPSLGHKAEGVFRRAAALGPDASAREALAWLWTQPSGLVTLPFGEFGGPDYPWSAAPAGLQSAALSTTAGLDLDRTASGDWRDLALPLSAGLAVGGQRGLEGSAEYRAATVSLTARTQAVNLFGTLGAQPLVTWYRTEVLAWNAGLTWSGGTRTKDQHAEATGGSRVELVLTPQETVVLPLSYQGVWGTAPSQTLGLKPSWSLKMPADLPFSLPGWISPRAFRRTLEFGLSADTGFGWSSDGAPVLRNLEFVSLTRFLLSDKSELKLTGKWGTQWQSQVTVVGLEADLDLILSF